MTNRFYNLPYDLQLLCHQFSNQFVLLNFRKKYNAAIIIQSYWRSTYAIILPVRQNASLLIN